MTTFRSELRIQLVGIVVALLCGCNDGPPPGKPTIRPSLAADESGVLGFRISQPTVLYGLVRQTLVATGSRSGRTNGLPQSLSLLVVSVLGLPPLAAGRFAEQSDWVGVVSRTPFGAPTWAMAVPLQSGREFVAELTLGAAAPRRALQHGAWTEFEGPNLGPLGALCAGVSGNWLLFGANCQGVDGLASRLTTGQIVAPAVSGPGLGVRLLAGRTVLQGVHAAWSEGLGELFGVFVQPTNELSLGAIQEVLGALNTQISAYLAHVESGEFEVRFEGTRVVLNGKLAARSLPVALPLAAPTGSLCDALARVPRGTRFWVAGTGQRVQSTGLPDWESEAGAWEQSILNGLAYTLGERFVPSAPRVAAGQGGQWLVGVRESERGRTFWAMLEGETPERVLEGMPGEVATGRAAALSAPRASTGVGVTRRAVIRDGRVLEWAVTPWRSGVALAVGAPLHEEWERWATLLPETASTTGGRAVSCHSVLGAIGVGSHAELVVERHTEGLELRGSWDVKEQWSTKP
jgi:hypothetical protein